MRSLTHLQGFIETLAQVDELFAEVAAAEVGVEDGGGVDQLAGLLRLSGAMVGQGQAVPRIEPGSRACRRSSCPEPLDVDRELVGFQTEVGVRQVSGQAIGGGRRCLGPGARATFRRGTIAAEELRARVRRRLPSQRCSGLSSSACSRVRVRRMRINRPKRRSRRSDSDSETIWSSKRAGLQQIGGRRLRRLPRGRGARPERNDSARPARSGAAERPDRAARGGLPTSECDR